MIHSYPRLTANSTDKELIVILTPFSQGATQQELQTLFRILSAIAPSDASVVRSLTQAADDVCETTALPFRG